MKTTAKRTLSFFLVLALCFSLGLTALAEEQEFSVNISGQTTLAAGETTTLSAQCAGDVLESEVTYVWTSDNISVAAVDRDTGFVTAGSAGSATITCTAKLKADEHTTRSADITIYVINNTFSVYLDETNIKLSASSTDYALHASFTGGSANGVSYSWSAEPAGIVSVTSGGSDNSIGYLAAIGSGRATVTVTGTDSLNNRDTATCIVDVASSGITVKGGGSLTMKLGETQTISATVSGGSGTYSYSWQRSGGVSLVDDSSASGSAKVRADNTPDGTVTLTVYDQFDRSNYASVTWNITVSSALQVTGAEVKPNSVTLDTFSSYYLSLSVSPSNAGYSVTWSSSNTKVASVSGSGASATVSTYGNDGTAVITAAVRDNGTGKTINATCTIYVNASSGTYNPSLTITYGSDYNGTSVSDSIYNQFYNRFGVRLPSSATVRFTGAGSTNIGQLFLSSGRAISSNTNYSFSDLQKMSFTPYQAGTFSIPYSVAYSGYTLSGTISIYVRGSNLSVSLSKASISLPTYSSQYLDVSVTPGSAYYRVSWSSSNPNIAAVTGSGNRVTVTSQGKTGSATISAAVTDGSGIQIVKTCAVTVTGAGATYSPSKVITIGTNVAGTTLADSLANQYKSVYGAALNKTSATIRFSSLGDSAVAVRRLANGTLMTANTDYTFQQYIDCYTDPASEGTLTTPYTLTYNGKSLSGNLIVEVHPATVSAGITLPDSTGAYSFGTSLASGASGAGQITSGLNSALASASSASWSYVRFSAANNQVGMLYANSSRTALTTNTNVTADGIANLYFVPSQSGTFIAAYTAYSTSGGVVAKGTLSITVPAGTTTTPTPTPAPGGLRVQLSNQGLTVNGAARNTQVYNINDENYFRLRDIAFMLNGTGSQFAVGYNDAMRTISLTTGQSYSPLGTEMDTGADYSSTCVVSNIPVIINGTTVNLTAYNINDNTFYRLRDLGDSLGFNVGYDAATRTVSVTSR